MKKFYYSFTPTGTLKRWLTCCKEWPELVADIEPAYAQPCNKQTQGEGFVPLQANHLRTGELPVIIECLLYYQQYYNLN